MLNIHLKPMQRLLTYGLMILALCACSADEFSEVLRPTVITPDTIVVSLEATTRIELDDELHSVWSEGDEVSLFYHSDANQRWAYDGPTGERTAELHPVDVGTATTATSHIVMLYPYSDNYTLNTTTLEVATSLPSLQHYKSGSYGLNGNILVATATSDDDLQLKSLYGWIRVQLIGNGEHLQSLVVRGNGGEQLAGDVTIDTQSTTMHFTNDGNYEILLDCHGVTLTTEPTALYIALPPQRYTQGISVDVACESHRVMHLTTTNEIDLERNHIQPLAVVEYTAERLQNNEIYYTADEHLTLYNPDGFNTPILHDTWDSTTGEGIITLYDSVTSIGEATFAGCTALRSITLPESLESISDGAFAGCTGLRSFVGKHAADGGRAWIVDGRLEAIAPAGLTAYSVPEGVTTIGRGAFALCTELRSITLPKGLQSIDFGAFTHCIALQNITLPSSVTTLGDFAFYWCYDLQSIVLSESLSNIGESAFYYCNALRSITIPSSVTTIGDYAFNHCGNLKELHLGSGLKSIGYATFAECKALESIIIPDGVTNLGEGAFYGCSGLKSATIGEGVEKVSRFTFQYCTALEQVAMGSNIAEIGMQAFYHCTSLTDIYISTMTAPLLGDYAFDYNDEQRRIYVPTPAVTAYTNDPAWQPYALSITAY